jgi:hypothetical protein
LKKLNYEDVKSYINSTGETLISKEYINYNSKLDIKCNKCGNIYSMNLTNFKKGKRCNKCAKNLRIKKMKLNYEDVKSFINSTGEILISTEYNNCKEKLNIKCNKCGNIYSIRFCNFKQGNRCNKCSIKERNDNNKLLYEDVRNYINSTGEELISKEYKGCKTSLQVKCKKCNKIYKVRFNDFKQGNRCSYCKASKGEERIRAWLENNHYIFEEQYKFDDCKYKRYLPFDFKLEDKNGKIILIEYDGIQHYQESFYGNNLKEQKKRDSIKDNYCNSHNNIDLYRIPYTEFNNIDSILKDIFNKYIL